MSKINLEIFKKFKLALTMNNNIDIFSCDDCKFMTKHRGCLNLHRDIIFIHQRKQLEKISHPSLVKTPVSDIGWCISVYNHLNRIKH